MGDNRSSRATRATGDRCRAANLIGEVFADLLAAEPHRLPLSRGRRPIATIPRRPPGLFP